MGKINALTSEERKKKVIIISIITLIILLMSFGLLLRYIIIIQNRKNLSYDSLRTVEDVLNYYECKYISEKEINTVDFDVEIKLEFKHNLYDGETSNEKFFNNVINDVAKVLYYKNFIMIDKSKDIEIKVICENNEVYEIIINDIYEYFEYMNSQISLKKYEELPITDMQIESPLLQSLIENKWDSKMVLGTRDSIFENYKEYFEEGIKTRTINGKIYNVLFNKRYKENIINGIFPGVDTHTVELILGEPTFYDDDLKVVGYKGKDVYVFFTDDEISVYRVDNIEINDFWELVDKFLDEDMELLEFMNELTYLWPDYTEYDYNENSVFLSYPLKGIDIKLGYDDTSAIVVYNNIKSNLTQVKKYLESPEFVSNLKIDNLFEAEKRRISTKNNLLTKCNEYYENLEKEDKKIIGKSSKFSTYTEVDNNGNIIKLFFISLDGNYPDREIYDNVGSYLWLNDDYIAYSQSGNGIYIYNVTNGNKQKIVENNNLKLELKGFENGILKYDNLEIGIGIQY